MSHTGAIPKLHPKYVTDAKGRKVSVMLDMKSWRKLQELLEDLEDNRLIDESIGEPTVGWEEVKDGLKRTGKL